MAWALVILTLPMVLGAIQGLRLKGSNADIRLHALQDQVILAEFGIPRSDGFTPGAYERSPMLVDSEQPGSKYFEDLSNDTFKGFLTEELLIKIDSEECISLFNKSTHPVSGNEITSICIDKLSEPWKVMSLFRRQFSNVYGLGQVFQKLGTADGDRVSMGTFMADSPFGNVFQSFYGGANAYVQFPMGYFLGDNQAIGIFIDNPRKMNWFFTEPDWWKVWSPVDAFRVYVIVADDLLTIRQKYMDLVGYPSIPPKKVFGLWLSEFGFKSWDDVRNSLTTTRDAKFPIDGFMLDLLWFGSVYADSPDSPMGGLKWDESTFPNPSQTMSKFADEGIDFVAIEESYVSLHQPHFSKMSDLRAFSRFCDGDNQVEFSDWFGKVCMIDWSNIDATSWWHDNIRTPNLIQKGVVGHWTDLGEPEKYSPDACYNGSAANVDHRIGHIDVHNIYNLMWAESIYKGYVRNHALNISRIRPWIMSRAGAPGIHRFGGGMWSGDIASRLDVLSTHLNSEMHMSFIGVDYYTSDAGGFWRREWPNDSARPPSEDEMFTVWLANSAWFDFPVKPHTYNCGFSWLYDPGCPYRISPATIGDRHVNLFNLRQRYELVPFYYSLAYRSHAFGEPLVWPMVMRFQDDINVREVGHQKVVGGMIMVGVISQYQQRERDTYFPKGLWYNYHSGISMDIQESQTLKLNLYESGSFRLPAYVIAGSIIPTQIVDDSTMNVFNDLTNGGRRDDLLIKVFSGYEKTSFTLYEDDGQTVSSYDEEERPHYDNRTTLLSQQLQVFNHRQFFFQLAMDPRRSESYSGLKTRPTSVEIWFPFESWVDQVTITSDVTHFEVLKLCENQQCDARSWTKKSTSQSHSILVTLGDVDTDVVLDILIEGRIVSGDVAAAHEE